MSYLVGVIVLPLAIVAGGTGMALTRDDPVWLVFGAVLAIATSYLMRRNSGS
ncbi:MAG: hypothetical protein AB7U75_13520 [Hyphomicrobiaceae bacterium]